MTQNYEIYHIPLAKIYSDWRFNCRQQELQRADVLDLIESIKGTRLEQPIVVQPLREIKVITPPPPGVEYRVLNGNRRYTAMCALHLEYPGDSRYQTIPSIIRLGLSDDDARALNLVDNLAQCRLNLLQEALALEHWYKAGWTRDKVATAVNQSSSWVQIRFNLLDLPPDLQAHAARGTIGQQDVKDLYQYRHNLELLYQRAREIIQHRLSGQKPPKTRSKRAQARAKRPGRARTRGEMEEMLMHVGENIGASLVTRVLAWAAGNISTFELILDIKKTTQELGKTYIPLDEAKLQSL